MAAARPVRLRRLGLKLAPMVRAWPGENQQPARAVFGLECLARSAPTPRLMQLNGIAQKLEFKGLKAKAAEMMGAIAADRGLTADRAGGPDRPRLRPRRARRPRLRLRSAPVPVRPRARDEADGPRRGRQAQGRPAQAECQRRRGHRRGAPSRRGSMLKKQVREVAKMQAERLEQAMVTGRRWTPGRLRDAAGPPPADDQPRPPRPLGRLRRGGQARRHLPHHRGARLADVDECHVRLGRPGQRSASSTPCTSTDEQRSAWGEIFGDYEIIPPFPQLGRTVHRLEPGEETARELVAQQGDQGPGHHAGRHPRRGTAGSAASLRTADYFSEHSRPFEWANVTAVIKYAARGGIPIGMHGGLGGSRSRAMLLRAGDIHAADGIPSTRTRCRSAGWTRW